MAEQAWPAEAYSSSVNLTDVEGPGTNDFYVDMSGAFWNPVTRRLWVCRNGGPSKFWVLKENGSGGFEVDTKGGNRGEWTNYGDLEDITQADLNEDVVYLMVEGEERIKEVNVSTYGSASVVNNWNTSTYLPLSGGSGAEGIAFVPDSFLSAAGFVDPSGNPRVSHNGMGGLMFVAHQNGGRLYVFDLNRTNGTFDYVGAYKTGYGESCALSFDRSDGLFYIFHGANYNRTEVTDLSTFDSGGEKQFTQVRMYQPPTGAASNSNMEGITVVPNDDCSNGERSFFLAIDGGGAESLMLFRQFPCTVSNPDADGDGVNDDVDACPGTSAGATVNSNGCSCAQLGSSGPAISSHPASGSVCSGSTRQFCVTATGNSTLSYQWQKDGSNIGGANASCYTASAAGSYRCVVTDICGSTTSNAATLTANSAPSVSSHPTGGSICPSSTIQVCVTATGSGTLSYQWQKDSVNISGATSSCYTANAAGAYRCVVTNSCGSATSNAATVSVLSAPSITANPSAAAVCSGQTHQFCVTATGSGMLTYQWQKDSVNISGATSSCYTASAAGSYRCVVSNSCGGTTSNAATLTVRTAPAFTANPVDASICSGTTNQFCVTVTGSGPLTYQWQRNGSNISGATSLCYSTGTAGAYRCVVSNSCGSATSSAATLTIQLTMLWYPDADGDGYGDVGGTALSGCSQPAGYVSNGLDCDDTNANINPTGTDVCGEDRNCDSIFPSSATWYRDADNDGFGDPANTTTSCGKPAGHVDNAMDCDDTHASVYTGAAEICDGLDNDCNGFTDELGDSDNDGVDDCTDACPGTASGLTVDSDGCSCSQISSADSDGDGVSDCDDVCPGSASGAAVDANGCACTQLDSSDDDGDGVLNCDDHCPGTSSGSQVDGDGCACVQLHGGDQDRDGVGDCFDLCPNTPAGLSVESDGCSCKQRGNEDSDGDGVSNCADLCPDTPALQAVNADGCSCTQLNPGDDDGDGVANCDDECPATEAGATVNEDGCPSGGPLGPTGPVDPTTNVGGGIKTDPIETLAGGNCGSGAVSAAAAAFMGMIGGSVRRRRRR